MQCSLSLKYACMCAYVEVHWVRKMEIKVFEKLGFERKRKEREERQDEKEKWEIFFAFSIILLAYI